MKRGTPDHPKTRICQHLLGLRRYQVVGVLESLWHFAANYAKRGDIGKWSDVELAKAIDWDGDATVLITALVDSGYIDRCGVNRLVIHDWADHADQTVERSREVQKLGFASAQLANAIETESHAGLAKAKALSQSLKPKPKPKPEKLASASKSTYSEDFEAWWLVYPKHRRAAKGDAAPEFDKALKIIASRNSVAHDAALKLLMERTGAFAASPEGQGRFCPHPRKWLKYERWEDDPAVWLEKKGGTDERPTSGPGSARLR